MQKENSQSLNLHRGIPSVPIPDAEDACHLVFSVLSAVLFSILFILFISGKL